MSLLRDQCQFCELESAETTFAISLDWQEFWFHFCGVSVIL
jgi:hypothetical protein